MVQNKCLCLYVYTHIYICMYIYLLICFSILKHCALIYISFAKEVNVFQIQKRFLKIKQKYGFRICYFKNLPTHKVGGWGRKEIKHLVLQIVFF